jgi:two-component system chemotaxis response regulator CheY
MNEELDAARARASRYGHLYTLAICDIDDFKRYNDVFGHLAGDDVLQRVADALRTQLRSSDSLYRYGGEEFVVLLPEQTLSDGVRVLDRIRAAVEHLGITSPTGRPLTISAGVAELNGDRDATVSKWIERADVALYQAKTNGRNRVEPGNELKLAACK